MTNKSRIIVLSLIVITSFCFTGCTTTQKSSAVGTGIGAGLGAAIGAAFGGGKGALIGAGIGALSGAAGGAIVGDMADQKREQAEKAELQRQLEIERKSSSGQGKSFIEGHNEYVKKRKWVDTSKQERVWVEEYEDETRKVDGHYETRNVPGGYWEEYEEKTWIPDHYE